MLFVVDVVHCSLSLSLSCGDRRGCSLFVNGWLCVVVCCLFWVLLLIVICLLFDVVRC